MFLEWKKKFLYYYYLQPKFNFYKSNFNVIVLELIFLSKL